MFSITVESDIGKRVDVKHQNDLLGGNLIFAFISGSELYCTSKNRNEDSEVTNLEWFTQSAFVTPTFCANILVIFRCMYSGEWNYSEKDYPVYLKDTKDTPLTEGEFVKVVQHVQKAWVDIEKLEESIASILDMFSKIKLSSSPWYQPEETTKDFKALYNTLQELKKISAKRVRLNVF